MRTIWGWIIGVIVIAAIVVGVIAATGNDNKNNNSNKSPSPPPTSSNNTKTNQPTATNKVTIENFSFSPADITVKKGATVTWTNSDNVAHTVTADANAGHEGASSQMASENLESGETYSFTFNSTGTFTYHCSLHPDMKGSVTVTE